MAPQPRQATIDKFDRLLAAWPQADSMPHAFELAGIKLSTRKQNLLRRQAEEFYNIELPSLNPQFSTEVETMCPSTLDLTLAKTARGIVTTSYTNNTTLEANFFKTLEAFCKAKEYQLLVKPVRYKNPTSMQNHEPYHWDKRVIPYVINEDFHFSPSLVFSATSLQATVANPLAGKQLAYKTKSVVYGSNFLECDSVATSKGKLPKMLFSTGSCNKPKYSNSNEGIKALSRHTISAILFIKVGNYVRDYILEWDGNGFSFFEEYWTTKGLANNPATYEAIHFGDTHAEGLTDKIINQRIKLVKHLNPKQLIWNDLHNHGAASHHNTMIENIRRYQSNTACVRSEVKKSVDVLNKIGKGRLNVIVRSNHHDHLEQWLNRCKPNQEIHNAEYYFELMNKVNNSDKCALELAMEDDLEVDYIFVDGDGEYDVAGIDCGQHGDKGPDGARSAASFHKLAVPIQSGHTHKRSIKGLHWSSGVMPLELGYNKGYGTWSSTDTPITSNGTRTHITFIKGKYWS